MKEGFLLKKLAKKALESIRHKCIIKKSKKIKAKDSVSNDTRSVIFESLIFYLL